MFSDFEINFFGQLLKVVRPCCQTRILRVPRITLYLFENNVFFVTCFNVDQEKFSPLSEKVRPDCPNCSLCFHRNNSKKTIFLKKNRGSLKNFGNWMKNFWHSAQNNFVGAVKTKFNVSLKHYRAKKLFFKKYNLQNMFVYRAKKFNLFRNDFCGVAKTTLYVSIEIFRRKALSWKRFWVFLSFRTLSGAFVALYQESINEAVKTTIHVSVGSM